MMWKALIKMPNKVRFSPREWEEEDNRHVDQLEEMCNIHRCTVIFKWQTLSTSIHKSPQMTSHFQLFLLIICISSRAWHFWRPQGIRTMLVTYINPAIGSGSMLPGIARLYVWADRWKAVPNLLAALNVVLSRLAIIPLLFKVLVLREWHIFNHCYNSAKAQVAFSAVAVKLICMIFFVHYSWTLGATQAWFHLVQSKSNANQIFVCCPRSDS